MADLPAQAMAIQGGLGHVLVRIYILGNDLLLRHIDEPAWSAAWTNTFEYFTEPSRV